MRKNSRNNRLDLPMKIACTRYVLAACTAVMILVTPAAARHALAQDQPTHAGHTSHEGMPMAMDDQTQMDAAHQRKLLADKKESEKTQAFSIPIGG